MTDTEEHVWNLVFGQWRSRILYTGVELGVFEIVGDYPKHAIEIADLLDLDRDLGYRLLRALGSLGLLEESSGRRFSISPAGALLQKSYPKSLRGVARLEAGPTHYALWKHLPDLVRDGEQNAFGREFGHSGFVEHRDADPRYAEVFDEAMTGYSRMETAGIQEMLGEDDFAGVSHVCDVAGGYGHLLCTLLAEYSHIEGTVLELPPVVADEDRLVAPEMGVTDRCTYLAGDMFETVPEADVYLLKNVLHDWDDDEYRRILSTIRESAPADAHLFVIERIVPGPDEPHFAKLFDLHMGVTTTGRERTAEEHAELLEAAGWRYVDVRHPTDERIGAVEAVPAERETHRD